MKFLNGMQPPYELTFNDVFLVPSYSEIASRLDVSLTTPDNVGTNIPIVVANMNAVAGKRMAETVARRGGITILPQDMPSEELASTIDYVKSRDLTYETPITLSPEHTIQDALNLINKRAHRHIIIVDNKNIPVGIFSVADAKDKDRFSTVGAVMNREIRSVQSSLTPKKIFEILEKDRISFAPVVDTKGKLQGAVTKKGVLRSLIFPPAINSANQLMVAVAVGINKDVANKVADTVSAGADIIVVDTAHGHQKKMIDALKAIKKLKLGVPIVAGNVATASGTKDLLEAGADIVKVGIGPGAMCTTRMMTGVGRPQFSAILECASQAKKLGKHIWADGGVRHPRDVALAIAAGASNVMVGTWFAGTHESVSDTHVDESGRKYKVNYGMASRRAVVSRSSAEEKITAEIKQFFEEGISKSKMYINPSSPGVEDIIDQIAAGLRSSMTYAGAKSISDFQDKAVVGIQSAAGFSEGQPISSSWNI